MGSGPSSSTCRGTVAPAPIPDDASIGWMADRVAETIAAQGRPPVTLVGLSMGGGVAQVLALEHPELVRALVLVSTSPVFPAATRQRFLDRADLAEREGMGAVVDATVPRWFTPGWMAAHPDEVERDAGHGPRHRSGLVRAGQPPQRRTRRPRAARRAAAARAVRRRPRGPG